MNNSGNQVSRDVQQGMSLRDWLAGQALNGFLAAHLDGEGPTPEDAAQRSRAYADALITELAK